MVGFVQLIALILLCCQICKLNAFQLNHPASRARKLVSTLSNSHGNKLSSKAYLSSLDSNGDGIITVEELLHSPIALAHLNGLRDSLKSTKFQMFIPQLKRLFRPLDITIIFLLCIGHKFLLRTIHKSFQVIFKRSKTNTYEDSFLGFMQKPISHLIYFIPFVYLIDVISIFVEVIGFNFHVKSNLPKIASELGIFFIGGSFLTKVKDYFIHRRYLQWNKVLTKNDKGRENTLNELSSILIWGVFFILGIEAMSIEFGFAIGSVFAMGGIGGASFVLALKSTMQNLIGGVALRLQDKFRVGDTISLSSTTGVVQDITFLETHVRKADNSFTTVPNHVFTAGEVVNWSRTPYRLYKTSTLLSIASPETTAAIIESLTNKLKASSKVLTSDSTREPVVSLNGFDKDKLVLQVSAHLLVSNEIDLALTSTEITNYIAEAVRSTVAKH